MTEVPIFLHQTWEGIISPLESAAKLSAIGLHRITLAPFIETELAYKRNKLRGHFTACVNAGTPALIMATLALIGADGFKTVCIGTAAFYGLGTIDCIYRAVTGPDL